MPNIDNLKKELNRLREEVDLKMHLASLEAKEEWDELETKWRQFSSKARFDESADSIGGALKQLGEELKKGYKRLLQALKD